MILYTIQTCKDPYKLTYGQTETNKTNKSIVDVCGHLKHLLYDNSFTAIRVHFYEINENGMLSYLESFERSAIKKAPRVINKKHDKHHTTIKENTSISVESGKQGQILINNYTQGISW